MAEYFEREALLKKLSRMIDYCKKDQKVTGLTALFQVGDAIMDCPAADVAPVVRGRWISFLDGDHIMPERYYRCSRCGRVESRRQPYCHCGATMDGGMITFWTMVIAAGIAFMPARTT